MKAPDRDLLVLMKDEFATQQFMEQELEQLNNLLFHYETMDNFCTAHEIFDVNKFRIVRKQKQIQKIARQQELKPFQFLCNKN
ncbi:MAG: hypothetical protein C5B59_09175 [Bacteroidetes bacterium]|nr:MAG: hypothetical protein C5B59_09175 [Bacteroidota bacterium]